MTPSEAYKAGLEAAAKVADEKCLSERANKQNAVEDQTDREAFVRGEFVSRNIAAAIRALPVPSELEKS